MTKDIQPDWSAIKTDYQQPTITIKDICQKYNISISSLSRARKRLGWVSRGHAKPPTRQQLISRMFVVLEKQIRRMEMTMVENVDDKEIALLGQLARTLEKLVDLDTKNSDKGPGQEVLESPNSREMKALRQKLTRRIGQLALE